MNKNSEKYWDIVLNTMSENLKKRQMVPYIVSTMLDAKALLKTLIKEGDCIAWGGSETLSGSGIISDIKANNTITYIDRLEGKTPEEITRKCLDSLRSDVFLMSSNAITKQGELLNVDGKGNRVQGLIMGPKSVVVIVGINKVVENIDEGYQRIRNIAGSMNALRLDRKTPCKVTGKCHECFAPECMCANIVLTRYSYVKERIKVILVKECLGF